MGGRGGASPAVRQAPGVSAPSAAATFSADQVRAVYDRLARDPGDWVNIADIRDAFPGVSRERMDGMLRDLEQRQDVNIVPQSNEKALTQRARDAGIRIGGQVKHFIAMGI